MSGFTADPSANPQMGAPAPPPGLAPDTDDANAVNTTAAPDLMKREPPEPDEARRKLVSKFQASIKRDKAHWKKTFDKMREHGKLARHGAKKEWIDAALYVVNVMQAVVNGKVAKLYAKNPRIKVTRRKTLDFKLWDGNAATLQAAAMDPVGGAALMADVAQGSQRRKMLDGLAATLEIVAQHQVDHQRPPFKVQMKQTVARTIIAGVGYVKLGYQRDMQPPPEVVTLTSDLEARMANIERLQADVSDDGCATTDEDSAEAEELKLALNELKAAPLQVQSEGLRFDFPLSTAIIPDKNTKNLRGFIGSDYVTEEFVWTVHEVQELFGIDVSCGSATNYYAANDSNTAVMPVRTMGEDDQDKTENRVAVWCMYHRKDGLVYWLCDGYKDFLSEPAPPSITLERFYPWFALTFNIVEDGENPFPPSDIELMEHAQQEINRSRQGIRDHRIANRPKYVTPRGTLTDEDKENLSEGDAHDIIETNGLAVGQKIEDLIQAVKHVGIDQGLYDVNQAQKDIQLTTGSQSADMGAVSGGTATEVSVAENAHSGGASSNIDDMDSMLSEMMGEAGRVLLLEMDAESVTEIAGPGATWPAIAPEEVLEDVSLDIEMGSSGRPNKAAEVQAFTQMAPIVMQIPGINPLAFAKEAIKRMDDKLDPSDFILDGVPSMMAMARIQGPPAMSAPAGGPLPGNMASGAPGGPVGGAPPPPGAGAPPPGPPGLTPHPAGPPGGFAGPPPGAPPPGAPPAPAMGMGHPQAMIQGHMGGMGPPAGAPPGMGGGHMNTPGPPAPVFRPPARPAPGPGNVPMGGA